MLNTTDGGATWNLQGTDVGACGEGLYFVDDSTGWAVDVGTIYHTTNGGDNWIIQDNIDWGWFGEEYLYGIHFVDKNTGWAVGGNYTVLKTDNGGSSWTVHDVPGLDCWCYFRSVYFSDENTGWIVGGGEKGVIYKTTDGGANWETEMFNNVENLRSVSSSQLGNSRR